MRELKAKAVLSKDKHTFDLKITKQTHFGSRFGGGYYPNCPNDGNHNYSFSNGNGVIIASWNAPSFKTEEEAGGSWGIHLREEMFLFLGEGKNLDNCVIKDIHINYYTRVKEAIVAYNEFYRDK